MERRGKERRQRERKGEGERGRGEKRERGRKRRRKRSLISPNFPTYTVLQTHLLSSVRQRLG